MARAIVSFMFEKPEESGKCASATVTNEVAGFVCCIAVVLRLTKADLREHIHRTPVAVQ